MCLLFVGCGGDDDGASVDAGESEDATVPAEDGGPTSPTTLVHAFDAVHVEAYEELSWQCQSWTLGNDEPLYVTAVRASNEGAWHHSNWFFVPETVYPGPDGTFRCSDRDFDEVAAGVAGGVFFAQSTQAASDVQAFPPGTAIRIPPRHKIIGDIHLLNLGAEPMDTAMTFEVDTVPASAVETELTLVSFSNTELAIPPRSQSRFAMECDYTAVAALAPFDFRFYYALPHFHSLGTYFKVEAIGGPSGDITIVETRPTAGEGWGVTLDPPVDVTGATGLRLTCGYDNPRDATVGYGIGDQEMCVFLAYTDARFKITGLPETTEAMGEVDGIPYFRTTCGGIALPR
jgi:hypothetical protein